MQWVISSSSAKPATDKQLSLTNKIAVADWFGELQVLDIDITGWTGGIGQEIRVKAQGNVKVTVLNSYRICKQ